MNAWLVMFLSGFYPQLCHQLSELVNSSKQMSSSLANCLTVFVQQEQVSHLNIFGILCTVICESVIVCITDEMLRKHLSDNYFGDVS